MTLATKYTFIASCMILCSTVVCSQEEKVSGARFVIGVAGPELIHAGITYRIVNASQVGLSAGVGPSWGEAWTSVNFEHRLYFGRNDLRTNLKSWFFRQGTTFFPAANAGQQFTINLTAGKDIKFGKSNSGITIDAGVFHLPGSERSSIILVRSLSLWPALRFQFYFPL